MIIRHAVTLIVLMCMGTTLREAHSSSSSVYSDKARSVLLNPTRRRHQAGA